MLGIITACVGTATYAVTESVPWLVKLHLTTFFALMAWSLFTMVSLSSHDETEHIVRGVKPAVAVVTTVSYWLIAALHAYFIVEETTVVILAFGMEYALWMLAFGAWKAREPERKFPRVFDYMVCLCSF